MVFSKAFDQTEIQDIHNFTTPCEGACYDGSVAEYRMENFPWTGADNEALDSGSGMSNGKAASQGTGSLPGLTSPSGGRICRSRIFTRADSDNGGYLDLGDPPDGDLDPGTDPWTISAWIKWDGSRRLSENALFPKLCVMLKKLSLEYQPDACGNFFRKP